MGSEELQLIVTALNDLGDDAKSAFIAWLVIGYGSKIIMTILGWTGGLLLASFVCKVFMTLIKRFWDNADA